MIGYLNKKDLIPELGKSQMLFFTKMLNVLFYSSTRTSRSQSSIFKVSHIAAMDFR